MGSVEFWTAVIAGAFALCAPVIFAGLGEIFLERAGGFNVGIEGMMLVGAVCGVAGSLAGGFWIGVLAGIGAGLLLGLILGLATTTGRADIIIVGIALGLLGAGLSTAIYQVLVVGGGNVTAPTQPVWSAQFLAGIPLLGRGLAGAGTLFYLALFLVILSSLVLRYTRFGLRLRAVGDSPQIAADRGLSVSGYRLVAALIAGALAGLGGAAVSLSGIGTFTPGMTGGAGFIALAVVIIARRTPWGLLGGALLFALFNSLALLAQTQDLGLPIEAYQALPYLVTLLILAFASRRHWRRTRLLAVPAAAH